MSRQFPTLSLMLLGIAGSAPALAQTPNSSAPPHFQFNRTVLDATGERPQLCLEFNAPLATQDAKTLARSVTLVPSTSSQPSVAGNRFCVGNLTFNTRYSISLSTAFTAADGQHLPQPLTLHAQFGARQPRVSMVGSGYILPEHTSHGVAIESINVDSLRIHVFQVRPYTQFPGVTSLNAADLDLGQSALSAWKFRSLLESSMQEVWHGTMRVRNMQDQSVTTAFPLPDVIGKAPQGLYLVTVENAALPANSSPVESALTESRTRDSNEGYSPALYQDIAARWVNVSDIGLTMLRGEDGLGVSVRSLQTGTPKSDVTLSLQARNGTVLESIKTGSDGVGHFSAPLLQGANAEKATALIAETGRDFSFLHLDRQWFDFSNWHDLEHLQTTPVASISGLQALIQSDRGIYRPGETVHLLSLIRDRAGKAVDTAHATLVLRRPDRMDAQHIPLKQGKSGGYTTELPLSTTVPTGLWHAEIVTDPTLPPIGTTQFEVNDFVPQIISVAFKAPDFATPDTPITLAGSARFLYGAAGSGLLSDSSYKVAPDPAPVPGYNEWAFGLENEEFPPLSGPVAAPPTDSKGLTTLTLSPEIPSGLTKPLVVDVTAGLLDPTGRRVSEHVRIPVRRTTPLIGVQVAHNDASGSEASPVPANIICFAPDNTPLGQKTLHWSLARVNRIYNWSHTDEDGWTFSSHSVDVPMQSGTTTTDAKGRSLITPILDWGEYRLTVTDPDSTAATSSRFFSGWGGLSSNTNTPDQLPVSTRDAQVMPNGKTILHIGSGFTGQAQITLATDHVLSTQTVDVPTIGLDVPLTATPEWHSGAYILVTLYRPLAAKSATPLRPHDPVRAVGLAWVGVNQSAHHLAVSLKAPKEIQPRTTLSVPVDVQLPTGPSDKPVYVAISAVDQGILSLTHFTPQDMFAALYGKPRLGVDMLDNYGALLLSTAQAGQIRSGGDSAAANDAAGPQVHSTQSVALFSGPVTLDAAGHGTVTFPVQDFDGQLHLMATAWTEDAVGNAQADTLSRDAVFPELGLPRFLAPGDTANILVSTINNTAPAGTYTVEITTDGPVHLTGAAQTEATLSPGARSDIRVPLAVDPSATGLESTGVAHIHLTLLRKGNHTPILKRSWPIGIRQAHQPIMLSSVMILDAGKSQTVDKSMLAGLIPASTTIALSTSAVAGVDSVALLQSLNASLWGTSADLAAQARALLLVSNPALISTHETQETLHRKVQSVVDTLLNRQSPSGEIGQWQANDGRSLPDDLIYMADFLIRAKNAGYVVPDDKLSMLLDRIESTQLAGDLTSSSSVRDLNERAYAGYVLARAGRLHPEAMRSLAASLISKTVDKRTTLLWADVATEHAQATPQAIGHLATALALGGEADDGSLTDPGALFSSAMAALGPARTERPPLELSGLYWAYVRDLACLAALAAEAHNTENAYALLTRFSRLPLAPDDLKGSVKTALLETAAALNNDAADRSLRIGSLNFPAPLKLPFIQTLSADQVQHGVAVENTGKKTLFVSTTVRGAPAGPVSSLDNGLSVHMQGWTLAGQPFDLTQMHQNDRFIVSIDGDAQKPGSYAVLISDLLPAGWEIEHIITPEEAGSADNESDEDDTKTSKPYNFLKDLTYTENTTARDDRFTAFLHFNTGDVRPTKRGFRVAYIARAITPGVFARPETLVTAHERPAIAGRTASSTVTILAQ
ncbi:alpha-2-macroglobulin family protein [Acetobacter cibinongensis]|uniref:alpha-2-macroglobulin family protein n=1 Tax=Acetobacter cibinongensis TaxID=146475 RepID=UPI00130EDEEA|nr:MG2 domain-containing protein [Acetobacter cibinongensis]